MVGIEVERVTKSPSKTQTERIVLPEIHPWVWPFLTPYQRVGISFAVGRRNAHLWWSCGAGKTVAAIIWSLAEAGTIVVVTRASARRQWANEVRRFSTVAPFVVQPPSQQKVGTEDLTDYWKRTTRAGARAFLIVGWPSLRDDELYKALMALPSFSVVFDELHIAKDHRRWDADPRTDGSVGFVRRSSVAARAGFLAPKASRRLGLTATPMPDRVRDLWAQFDTIEPGCAGKYWDWAKKFCGAYEGQYGWDDKGSSNLKELQTFANQRSHVVRSEEVYKLLPPIRRMTTYLSASELRKADAEANKEVKRLAKAAGGGTGTEDTDAAKSLLEARLMQAAARKSKHVVDAVVELMQGGQKVLVFTGRRRDVDNLRAKILKGLERTMPATKGVPWKLWAAHGETPPEDRETIREDYMAAPGPACIVGTGAAWGESLNLHDTDRLIVVLLPWTWGQIRQWEGRVRRLGMTRPCIIEYLVAEGTVDERISGVVLDKLAAVEAVLPDEQVTEVREAVQGGTDDAVIDGLLDRFME